MLQRTVCFIVRNTGENGANFESVTLSQPQNIQDQWIPRIPAGRMADPKELKGVRLANPLLLFNADCDAVVRLPGQRC